MLGTMFSEPLRVTSLQPENPAQLGGKIYEMMNMALSNKWSAPVAAQKSSGPQPGGYTAETVEAEIVEPVEAGSHK